MVWGCRLDSSGYRYGPIVDSCKHSTEPTDSIKRQEFLFSSQNGLCSMELVKIPHQRFGLSTSKIQIIHVTVKLMSYDASA